MWCTSLKQRVEETPVPVGGRETCECVKKGNRCGKFREICSLLPLSKEWTDEMRMDL